MNQSIESLKQEISEAYIKEFKKELGWLKSLTLLPIQNKVKNVLVGKTKLPEKFDQIEEFGWRKNIINFIVPSLATKIFNFMKEKSQEIERRKTGNELLELKNQVLGTNTTETPKRTEEEKKEGEEEKKEGEEGKKEGEEGKKEGEEGKTQIAEIPQENEPSSISIGIRYSLYGTAGVYGLGKLSNKIDRSLMERSLDAGKIKETINGSIKQLEDQKSRLNARLSDAQIKNIDKHIAKMKKGLDIPDADLGEVLKERQKLGNKIPGKLLESSGLSAKQINKIQDLAGELHGKSIDEIKTILKNNGINDVGDELLQTLGKAGSPSEIKSMAKILRHGSKFNRFMQTMSGAMLIDVAFLGFDVWMFIEQRKEAELIAKVNQIRANNKYNQATTQLIIGVSSVAAEVALVCMCCAYGSAGGPVGTAIGLAVGALTAATSIGVDSLYFDVKDFYLQNGDDFIRQKKSRVIEAILQGIHNKKKGNTSINEKVGSLGVDSKQKENSTESACWALMFLDELEGEEFRNYAPFREYLNSGKRKEDYINQVTQGLSEKDANEVRSNFEENRVKMENKIEKRMKYMNEIFKKDDVINALKNGNGIQKINQLCVESRIYAEIGQENRQGDTSRQSYQKNLDKLKSDCFKEFPNEKLAKLEKLKETNPELFQEIISLANYYSLLDEDETDSNYKSNVQLTQKYQERLKLTQINYGVGLSIADNQKNMRFIQSLIKSDFDLEKISEFRGNDNERVINIINGNLERRGTMEVSDDVRQNVLYRLAKELYSYNGPNTKEGIMDFFDEGNDAVHGIYYNDSRKINDDWGIDEKVKNEGIDKIFSSEDEVNKFVENFMKNNFTSEYKNHKEGTTTTEDTDTIDTPTEVIDKNLQIEFKRVFKEILTQELMQRTKQSQEKIKMEITNFVKKYSNGNYLELPYCLILKARRAGLGNLERQFLKRDNNQLEMCTLPTELSNNPLGAKVNYISKAREGYVNEEQIYIDRVEDAHKKLSDLLNFQGGLLLKSHESELDIPREVKGLVSDKYKEWNDFKERLLLYSPAVVTGTEVMNSYKQFAEYFENLYRGMLIALTTYKVSNDIDSYSLFQQAKGFGNSDYFGNNGEIKTDLKETNLDIDLFKNEDIRSFYDEQIKKQKIKYISDDGTEKEKIIEELRKSQNGNDKEIARRASNIIITTVVEKGILDYSHGEITGINIGGNRKDSDLIKGVKELKNETESLITDRLKKIKGMVLVDREKIQIKEQKIQLLSKEESKVTEKTVVDLQKMVENTAKNIERQNERGNITYDPEKKTIKSRGKKVNVESITENNIKLAGLNLQLTLKEGLRLANFKNWLKHTYGDKKVEYTRGIFNRSLSFKNTFYVGNTMLIARGDLERLCPVCKSDEAMEKITSWLNIN